MPHKDIEARRAYHRAYQRAYYASHRADYRRRKQDYRKRHPERIRERERELDRLRHERDREKRNAQGRLHYAKNIGIKREKARIYAANHREEAKARARAWHQSHPEHAVHSTKVRRAHKKASQRNTLSLAQWNEIKQAFKHCCAYCGRKMKRLEQDHITPLAQQGDHSLHNVVPACRSCNAKKHTGPAPVPVQPLLVTIAPIHRYAPRKN